MNKMQILETLNGIVYTLQNAMDEIDDIADNDIPKSRAQHYLIDAEMSINSLIDDIDDQAIIDGTKSGAV